jgi:hypothetical protein
MSSSLGLGMAFLGVGAVVFGGACGGASAVGPEAAGPADEAPRVKTSMVSASAVVSACPDGKRMNAKLAADTIQKLVDPCASVPGGKAHFSAALLPGGKIELAAPGGNAAEGVVPTCVLQHGLTHKVLLKSPCKFDVELEERTVKQGAGPG